MIEKIRRPIIGWLPNWISDTYREDRTFGGGGLIVAITYYQVYGFIANKAVATYSFKCVKNTLIGLICDQAFANLKV